MCIMTPKAPEPPKPPMVQKPAELEESSGVSEAKARRSQMLVKRRASMSGIAPTTSAQV